jgi:hypothetical protein
MSKQQERPTQRQTKRPACTITEVNKPNIDLIARSLISIYAKKVATQKG